MDTLSELAKKMGAETAFSAKECADALNYLALAGYDTQQMCDTLPTVLNLAAAGDIDLASASDMVTDAMSALGMGVDESTKMVDQMAKTASSTNTSVAQLGEGILTIGATAKSIKGGTAELNTALGILANNGIKGAEGGTHLRNVILSLQNPTDKAAAQMDALGVSVYDSNGNMRSLNDILGDLNKSMDGMTSADKANIIATIFNKTDLASVNALLANTGDTWDSLQNSITNSAGAAQQMADTQLDNLQGQITILKSALEGLAISFGELLMPAIKQIVDWVQKFVDWLNSMDEGTKKVVVTVALLAAAIGPVLIVIGKVISAVGTIMTVVPKIASAISAVKTAFAALNVTMLANPIVLIIAAITALVAAFIYLWNTNEGFRQFWIDLWEGIKQAVITAWNAITSFLSTAWENILSLAQTVWGAISGFFTTLWEGIKGVFTSAWEAISGVMTTIWNTITSIWQSIYDTISPLLEAFQYLFETIFEAIRILIERALTAISQKISEIWNGIVTFLTPILETIKNIFQTVWTAIQTVITTVLTAIKNVVTTIWNAIKTAVTTVLNAIKGVVSSVWNSIKSVVSTVMNAIKSTVTSIWNNVKTAIGNTIGQIYNVIHSGFEKAVGYVKGLASQAFSWGRDLIMGIVNGIKSAVGAVTDAVNGVANKIRSVLHFSVPDEGPLTDYESWMPDFM